jgi:rubrerythrin
MAELDFTKLDLRDALDLAILIEEEAMERYEEFTRTVGGRYKGDALEIFRRMVFNERKHRDQLAQLRYSLFQDQPVRVTRDQIDNVEAPMKVKARYTMSAREALDVALDSEVKAHEYFTRAARESTDPKVTKLFSDLREEEAEHKAMIERLLPDFPPERNLYEEDPTEEVGSDPG